MPHFLGEPFHGARDRHPRGRRRRLVQRDGELVVGVLELETADDRFAVGGRQALQRAFVSLGVLGADRLVEWRRGCVGELIGNLGLTWPPIVVARDIADAIQDRLPQVGLQRALDASSNPSSFLTAEMIVS